jgi:hypothetical protein
MSVDRDFAIVLPAGTYCLTFYPNYYTGVYISTK